MQPCPLGLHVISLVRRAHQLAVQVYYVDGEGVYRRPVEGGAAALVAALPDGGGGTAGGTVAGPVSLTVVDAESGWL